MRSLRRIIGWLLLPVLLLYHAMLLLTSLQLYGNDFGKFYYATQYARAGQPMYAASPASRVPVSKTETHEFIDMNPPHFHLVIVPFLAWSVRRAAPTWLIANLYIAGFAVVLMLRELQIRLTRRDILPILLGVLLCAATGATFVTGQFTGLLLTGMTLAWLAARQGRWAAAGAWLGLLIAVKPFLALFIPILMMWRHWRALAAMSAVIVASFALGLLVYGWQAHVDWFHALRGVDWPWAPMNGSLYGMWARAVAPSPYFTPLTDAPRLLTVLWMMSAVIIGVWTLLMARRSIDHGFAASILAALLMSPLGWIYYLWMALGPCVALWRTRRPAACWWAVPWLCVPLIVMSVGQPHRWATVTIGSAYTWGLLLLWLAVIRTPAQTE